MELIELKERLIKTFKGSKEDLGRILEAIEQDEAIFPFNEYEHLICMLMKAGVLTYEEYASIRMEYITKNPNLWIFEITAPRVFGEKFAQTYVSGKSVQIKQAHKDLDPNFSGEYDLWLNGTKIEVKASRAVDAQSSEPLYLKALSRKTNKTFCMNFQQLKPQCCDVFVWLGVFRDEIVTWVIGSEELKTHPLYAACQHRGNKGNEGQLHIRNNNIAMFDQYELNHDNICGAIYDALDRDEELKAKAGDRKS